MWIWILSLVVLALGGGYLSLFFYMRSREKRWQEQFDLQKNRYSIWVLNKKITKVRPPNFPFRLRNYQIICKVTISQSAKGINVSKAQILNFRTDRAHFEKIEINKKYQADIAGDFIGDVVLTKR